MDWLTEHAELAEGFLIPQASGQAATSVELAGALRNALSSPLDYPAFDQTLFAGDTVAIVLQQGLPKPRAVIEALLEMLASSDVALTDVTFVVSPTTAGSLGIKPSQYQPVGESDEDHAPIVIPLEFGLHQVNIQVHDANNHADQAYLAANTAGLPVYVNRTLVEADFVLPVGAPLPGDTALNDSVYPHFSGAEARERFDQRQDSESAREAEVELANDMLGSFFTVQLVCGPGEITHCVVCGERHVALDKARQETNALWQFPFEGTAKAAVATIEASVNQNWLDFAKAVNFAHQFVEPEGPIVVWSAISTKPDRWIKKVCQAQFDNAIDISKLPEAYQRLAHALADRPIYLKSELNQSEIEGLGIGYLQNENELVRLTQSFELPLLIRDAHLCQPLGEQLQSEDRP